MLPIRRMRSILFHISSPTISRNVLSFSRFTRVALCGGSRSWSTEYIHFTPSSKAARQVSTQDAVFMEYIFSAAMAFSANVAYALSQDRRKSKLVTEHHPFIFE